MRSTRLFMIRRPPPRVTRGLRFPTSGSEDQPSLLWPVIWFFVTLWEMLLTVSTMVDLLTHGQPKVTRLLPEPEKADVMYLHQVQAEASGWHLSLIHISEPTRLGM